MTDKEAGWAARDYVSAAAVMMLMGGFYWAIRGTGGYGGETGGMLAGFGWALLWYAFSRMGAGAGQRPYGSPWLLVAITFGIALGGFTGYGVYIGWVKGAFYLDYPDGMRPVSAWTGYAMLFLCGLHWGGNAGCFMAWCAPKRPLRAVDWALRIGSGIAGALAAAWFVRLFPQLFLPFYGEGLYSVPEYKTCVRALDSLHTIAPHVGLLLGFLAFEAARGDRRAVALILTMALGFAIPFSVGGYWQTFQDSALKLSWWKNWEMTIGLGGGLALGLAFWWFNRPGEESRPALGPASRALFWSGLPLWIPTVMVFKGLYEGKCEMAESSPTILGYVALLLIAAAVLVGVLLHSQRRSKDVAGPGDGFALSFGAITAFQGAILVSGWVVTIPEQWQLANTVLALLYIVYITVSLVLLAGLWCRHGERGIRQ